MANSNQWFGVYVPYSGASEIGDKTYDTLEECLNEEFESVPDHVRQIQIYKITDESEIIHWETWTWCNEIETKKADWNHERSGYVKEIG